MDSTSALELPDVPKSLLVVGGGYIGLELGTVYAALGTKVTVVEMTAGLLPGADRDLVNILAKRIEAMCEAVLLNTKVVAMKEAKDGDRGDLRGRGLPAERRKSGRSIACSFRSAGGRTPPCPGLDEHGSRSNARGFIEVDAARRTAEPSIYAIGDVVGEPMLAHKASHEGRVAVEAIAGERVAFEPLAIPAVVFTDPEMAWCGLTESDAQKQKREVDRRAVPVGGLGPRAHARPYRRHDEAGARSEDRARARRRHRRPGRRRTDRRRRPGGRDGRERHRHAHDASIRTRRCRKRSWNRPRCSSARPRTSTDRGRRPENVFRLYAAPSSLPDGTEQQADEKGAAPTADESGPPAVFQTRGRTDCRSDPSCPEASVSSSSLLLSAG